jgi:hypothetical protein
MLERPKTPGADHARIQEISMGNQQGTLTVTEIEIGWLCGIVDGEGTIAFSVYNNRGVQVVKVKPQIIVHNTDKPMIEKVADILRRCQIGVHIAAVRPHGRSFTGNKPTTYRLGYVATIAGFKRAKKALELMVPHLVSKKRKAELVLRYICQRELKLSANRLAALDYDDLLLIREIMVYSRENSIKGAKSKNIGWIEGLLNEHEQRGAHAAA